MTTTTANIKHLPVLKNTDHIEVLNLYTEKYIWFELQTKNCLNWWNSW